MARFNRFYLWILLALGLAACGGSSEILILPTEAFLPTVTPTLPPTETPMPSVTPMPTGTPPPTQVPTTVSTRTPVPTITPVPPTEPPPPTATINPDVATLAAQNATNEALIAALPTLTPTASPTVDLDNVRIEDIVPETYYVTDPARIRVCAAIDDARCPTLRELSRGDTVQVDGQAIGSSFRESAVWFRTVVDGRDGFIHSSLLSLFPPSPDGISTVEAPLVAANWTCGVDLYECDTFFSRAEMQSYYDTCEGDPSILDADGDGIPCEETVFDF